MNRDAQYVQNELQIAWTAVSAGMQKMYSGSTVKPAQAVDIFEFEAEGNGEIKFNIKPVVFHLPERATHTAANLYIAVTGWLSFSSPISRDQPLQTKSFGTKVGYFRAKQPNPEHVYGVHYDLDEQQPGHPVFHAQIGAQMDLATHVNTQFRKDWIPENKLEKILGNVRTPSAQMDVFSVVTQLCADHLLHRGSSTEVRQAFTKMRASCDFFRGAAYRMAFLNAPPAPDCYRSTHWYAGSP